MLYPRIARVGDVDELVNDNQCVGYKEHMADEHRILFLTGAIAGDMENHNLIMTLDSISHDPIKLVITSPGGDIDAIFLFYDTFKIIKSPVITIGRYCASGAALLLAAGYERYIYEDAKVMLHKPWGKREGDSRDWEIQGLEMKKYEKSFINKLISCGATKSYDEILRDIDRDLWMEPEETIAYGLADGIMTDKKWLEFIGEDNANSCLS